MAEDPVGAEDLGFVHVFEPGVGPATVLLLHATGGDERLLLALGRELAPGASLLSPRGKVLEGGTVRRFFARHGPAQLDVPDLKARAAELVAFVAAAAERYGFDPRRVLALGYSNGANVAAGILLGGSGALAGAALLRPMLPYEPEATPDLTGVGVLLCEGRDDPYAAVGDVGRLVEILGAARADVTRRTFAAGQELVEADLEAAGAWLQERLGQ
jgi:predicted esterase